MALLRAWVSGAPARAERVNMLVDAFAVGVFSGAMGLNPLPSLAIITMIAMNNIAAGGPRLLGQGTLFTLAGLGAGLLAFSPGLVGVATPAQVNACIPLLVLYPLSLGLVCYLTASQLAKHRKELKMLNSTDFLTGLKNRKAVNDVLASQLDAGEGNLANTVVALIDIDHFKAINDQHGHLVGDLVLERLSTVMLSCVGEQDIVGRFGGDEFCVILRDTEPNQAQSTLERIRAMVETHAACSAPKVHATLSIGAARYSDASLTITKWLSRADTALYQSKSSGRNRITFAC